MFKVNLIYRHLTQTTIPHTTFVESNLPPNPTSKIATSTCIDNYTKGDVSDSTSLIVTKSMNWKNPSIKKHCPEKLEDNTKQTCSAVNILKASKVIKRKKVGIGTSSLVFSYIPTNRETTRFKNLRQTYHTLKFQQTKSRTFFVVVQLYEIAAMKQLK